MGSCVFVGVHRGYTFFQKRGGGIHSQKKHCPEGTHRGYTFFQKRGGGIHSQKKHFPKANSTNLTNSLTQSVR